MADDRLGDERRLRSGSGSDRVVGARSLVRVGPWNVSAMALAWGLSAVLHAGLLTTSYLVTWGPVPVSNPEINFARGEQASRVQIFLEPWPDPSKNVDEKAKTGEQTLPVESPVATVRIDEAEVVPPLEDVPLEMDDDASAPDVVEDDAFVEDATEMPEEVVAEDFRDATPADNVQAAKLRVEQIEAVVERMIRRVERFLASVEVKEPSDVALPAEPPRPAVTESAEEPVDEANAERERSKASEAQASGIETGVEMLDLPTPKYPSLSRRQGEEGVVWLRVEVLADGRVGEITVLDNAGFARLTEAAIVAARAGRFNPATRDGRPIRATVRIPFRFVLR